MSAEFQPGESIVTIDRRRGDRRNAQDTPAVNVELKPEKRRKERRRQIDPTTCEREYTDDETEFMSAVDTFKRKSGRMFPTCSDILQVTAQLGYTRETECDDAAEEFVKALDQYKRRSGRMFPTCSELLEVVRDLGYAKSTVDQGL